MIFVVGCITRYLYLFWDTYDTYVPTYDTPAFLCVLKVACIAYRE